MTIFINCYNGGEWGGGFDSVGHLLMLLLYFKLVFQVVVVILRMRYLFFYSIFKVRFRCVVILGLLRTFDTIQTFGSN